VGCHCGGGPIGKGVVLVTAQFFWSAWAQTQWGRAVCKVVGLVSALFFSSAWAQSLLWLADRQGRWSGLSYVPFFRCVLSHCGGGPTVKALFCSRLCSFDQRGLIHCGGGLTGNGVGLVPPLFL
jgi:hypothetical protein